MSRGGPCGTLGEKGTFRGTIGGQAKERGTLLLTFNCCPFADRQSGRGSNATVPFCSTLMVRNQQSHVGEDLEGLYPDSGISGGTDSPKPLPQHQNNPTKGPSTQASDKPIITKKRGRGGVSRSVAGSGIG